MADGVFNPGDVFIYALNIIKDNKIFELDDFLVELNIYESIDNNFLKGTILLSDSLNIVENIPIEGNEYLSITITTPSFSQSIKKVFRITTISNRKIVRDNNTQMLMLDFISPEFLQDSLTNIYRSFKDDFEKLFKEIFGKLNSNEILQIGAEVQGKIKFICPGWSPFKCINWMASKCTSANDILFFQSNQNFYIKSISKLLEENKNIGEYNLSIVNVEDKNKTSARFNTTEYVDMISVIDYAKNYTSGYMANKVYIANVYNKKFDEAVFINPKAKIEPPGNPDVIRNFYPNNGQIDWNPNSIGNRKLGLFGLNNLKLNLNVPGRTDVEIGQTINFKHPKLGPRDETDKDFTDKLYSGNYLITAINHKITKSTIIEHRMIMEITKDF